MTKYYNIAHIFYYIYFFARTVVRAFLLCLTYYHVTVYYLSGGLLLVSGIVQVTYIYQLLII